MKTGILEEGKKYRLIWTKDKSAAVSSLTKNSAMVNYWQLEKKTDVKVKKGVSFHYSAIIPRMAGSDYFVDHGGEWVGKTVIVPENKLYNVGGILVNPTTGEYRYDDEKYSLIEETNTSTYAPRFRG